MRAALREVASWPLWPVAILLDRLIWAPVQNREIRRAAR